MEVGVGGRWDALEELARTRPDLLLAATDVRLGALDGAPEGVETRVDDLFEPDLPWYEGTELLYAVRCPEELQMPLARLASKVGAALALVVVKDELAAGLDGLLGPPELMQDERGRTWRAWWDR